MDNGLEEPEPKRREAQPDDPKHQQDAFMHRAENVYRCQNPPCPNPATDQDTSDNRRKELSYH